MPKQFLIGGFILALLFAGSVSAQAKMSEPTLLSQVQEEPSSTPAPGGSTTSPGSDGSMTSPAPDNSTVTPAPDDSTTTPVPDDSTTTPAPDEPTTTPNSDGSNTGACESVPLARPTGGATRERLQDVQPCNKGV